MTPNEALKKLHEKISSETRIAFFTTFIVGLLAHMMALTFDIPNHDGLASMYFDQNMITSGRWFLTVACAISSYYTIPWLIGILSLIYLSVANCFLVNFLGIENRIFIGLSGALLVTFPSLAGNFAYVFTMDGYMMGVLLSIVAVWCVEKFPKFGFLFGAAALGFSMGIYQSYVAIAILLTMYGIGRILMTEKKAKEKLTGILKYVGMGAIGAAFYYVMLRILLAVQGKELDTYQGISGMADGNGAGLLGTVKLMYKDFITFSFNSHVFMPDALGAVVTVLLLVTATVSFVLIAKERGLLKKPLFYVFTLIFVIALPCAMNAILLISTDVTYHVLMRYQWAFLLICALAIVEGTGKKQKTPVRLLWMATIFCTVLCFEYAVTDNIAYSNLQKRYEKTYAYCVRLLDRIEQTDGYYHGMPVAMVGVVGQDNFPNSDVTEPVTGSIIGTTGDFMLFKPENYQDFFKHFLGADVNFMSSDCVSDFYYEDFYAEMPSFPDNGSVKIVDGVMYVKTENVR